MGFNVPPEILHLIFSFSDLNTTIAFSQCWRSFRARTFELLNHKEWWVDRLILSRQFNIRENSFYPQAPITQRTFQFLHHHGNKSDTDCLPLANWTV